MNYEILNMTDAEKLANYDKLVEENKLLTEQRNYYKTEYDLIAIKNRNLNKEINRLISQNKKLERDLTSNNEK